MDAIVMVREDGEDSPSKKGRVVRDAAFESEDDLLQLGACSRPRAAAFCHHR